MYVYATNKHRQSTTFPLPMHSVCVCVCVTCIPWHTFTWSDGTAFRLQNKSVHVRWVVSLPCEQQQRNRVEKSSTAGCVFFSPPHSPSNFFEMHFVKVCSRALLRVDREITYFEEFVISFCLFATEGTNLFKTHFRPCTILRFECFKTSFTC